MLELLCGRMLPAGPLEQYVPHAPWPRQWALLDLDCREAFYGGAAAGGKSEALLMAALQHVHVPGYAALILRRDTQRLMLSGGLIPRSHEWLRGKGPTWNATERRWSFPTTGRPATLSFGYLQSSSDKYRYGSSEYQFIAFDELTEFPEDDYLFLFSRLRRTTDLRVPLRMRSASNPGGPGHDWVKRRFVGEGTFDPSQCVHWRGAIAFVPATIRDNPAVNEEEYCRTLAHLPPIDRQRLMLGDWSVRSEGLIRRSWLRHFEVQKHHLLPLDARGEPLARIDYRTCRRFVTIDPAGTSAQRAEEQRGRPPSWTVAQVWRQPLGQWSQHLFLEEVVRVRVGFEGLCRVIREVHARHHPQQLLIENDKLGQAAVDVLERELPISTIRTAGRDKVARAARLLLKLERGEVWLRRDAAWLEELETEFLSWTGLPQETCDQVDAAAYAALHADGESREITIEPMF
jgi:phage terminase large subunit-like protein